MEIKYLKELQTIDYEALGRILKNKPLQLAQIIQLEQLYNNGNPFPVVLRELLFIAGMGCPVIEVGYNDPFGYQVEIRQGLQDGNQTINRPFYGLDDLDFSSFYLVFLDENEEDPIVYVVHVYPSEQKGTVFLEPTGTKLSKVILSRIKRLKNGDPIY